MGSSIADLIIKVSADTAAAVKGLRSLGGQAKAVGGRVTKSFGSLGKTMAVGVVAGAKVAGGALAALGGVVGIAGFKFDNMRQQALIAFTTMLKSGEKAKSFLDDLQAFAAKTPFEFPELVSSSQKLLAMGFTAKQIIPTMTSIGDAVAGLGGSAETLDRVTAALGQIKAKGKASAEEMLQLTESGIPAWQFLADKIGTSVPEAMKKVSQGAIDADTTIAAVTEGMNKKFGGMMEAQSHTFGGLLSTIKDTFSQVSGTVMAPFFEMATSGMQKLVDVVSTPAFQQGVQNFAAALASTAQQIFTIVGQIVSWIHDHWSEISATISTTADVVKAVVMAMAVAIGAAAGFIQAHWQQIKAAAESVKNWYQSDLAPAIQNVVTFLRALWDRFGNDIKTMTDKYFTAVAAIVKAELTIVKDVVNFILAVLRGDWGKAWESLKDIPVQVLHAIVASIKGMVGIFLVAAEAIGKALLDGLKAGTAALLGWAKGKLGDLISTVRGFAGQMLSAAASIGRAIIDGIKSGVEAAWGGLVGYVQGKMEDLKAKIKAPWKIFSPSQTAAEEIGKPIMQGIAAGMDLGTADVLGAIDRSSMAVLGFGKGKFYDVGNQVGVELAHGVIAGFDAMKGLLTSAISAVMDAVYQDFQRDFAKKAEDLAAQIGKGPQRVGRGGGLNIPGFASGVRNFSGGLAVVGENGPELLNLPRGADVFSNSDSRGVGRSVTVNVNGATVDPLDEERLATVLRRLEVLYG